MCCAHVPQTQETEQVRRVPIFHIVAAVCILLSISRNCVSASDTPSEADLLGERFSTGLRHFDEGRNVDARWVFEQIVTASTPESEWHAPAELMLARTLFRLGDMPGAEQPLADLIQPAATRSLPREIVNQRRNYLPHARYLHAMIAWRNNNRRLTMTRAYEVAVDPQTPVSLAAEARSLARAVAARADSAEFVSLDCDEQYASDLPGFLRDVQQLNRATGLYHGGQWLAARMTAESITRRSPNTLYAQEIATLVSDVHRAESAEVKVAVIAPLGGPDSLAGAELIKGVRYAIEEQNTPLISQLVIRDVRTQLDAIHVVQELARDAAIRAIIGPLTTENTLAAAAVANSLGIPIITPTATGEGLGTIGPFVFQANTTPAAQGRILAQVAFDSLNARTAAVLSSLDTDDQAMADAFAEVFTQKGGEVAIQEWFHAGTVDIRPQLSQIRREGLLRDTTLSEQIRRNLEAREWTELDTMRIMYEVNTLDILVVSSSDDRDLVNIAAQIPTQKIWARVLGGFLWSDRDVRNQAGENAEGVIFTTRYDRFFPSSNRFINAYRMAKHDEPSIVAMMSYDATAMIIRAIAGGARTRTQVKDAVASTRNWPGASGVISFGSDGSNQEAFVRTIRGGVAQEILNWSQLFTPRYWGYAAPAPVPEDGEQIDGEQEGTEEINE